MAESFVDLGFARVDVDRRRRCGFPEVIFGAGKTPQDVLAISRVILEREPVLLELIERMEHDRDVLGHRIHNERMVLPFESRRNEAEDAEVRGKSTPLWNRLRADAAMRRRQAYCRCRIAAQPTRTLECHDVRRVRHQLRAAQRR